MSPSSPDNKGVALFAFACAIVLACLLYFWGHVWGAVRAILFFARDVFLGL